MRARQTPASTPVCSSNAALACSSAAIFDSNVCMESSPMDEVKKIFEWMISNIAIIISIVAIIASYFIGVYSNRKNDKRKEFNELVEPILIYLEEQYSASKSGVYDRRLEFPRDRFKALRRRMSAREQRKLDDTIDGYWKYWSMFHNSRSSDDSLVGDPGELHKEWMKANIKLQQLIKLK